MMNNAVIEFDRLVKQAGFAVDYDITDDNFTATIKPIAYRNISRADAGAKTLYLLWSVIAPDGKPAEDSTYAADINISLAFYAQDAWLYNKQDASVDTVAYHELLTLLEQAGWALEYGSEYPEVANEGSNTYVHRKDIIITKTFIGG